MSKFETLAAYVAARLAEPGTWQGIAFLLTLAGSKLGADLPIGQCVALGAGLSAIMKIIFPDAAKSADPISTTAKEVP